MFRRTLAAIAMTVVAGAPAMADWNGAYLGAYTGMMLAGTDADPLGGIQGGYSFSNGRMAFGLQGEMGIQVLGGPFAGHVGLSAQAGLAVGERGLFYGVAGVGAFYSAGTALAHYSFGMGIEFPVGANGVSIFIEPRAFGIFSSGCCLIQVRTGINWRP